MQSIVSRQDDFFSQVGFSGLLLLLFLDIVITVKGI